MPLPERLVHTLTAYHWRHNHSTRPTRIAMCSCGWRGGAFRRTRRTIRWRQFSRLCWLRGHDWDEPEAAHFGPVGFEESDDTLLGYFTQCDRCYKTRIS